jgi:hypothetical protein
VSRFVCFLIVVYRRSRQEIQERFQGEIGTPVRDTSKIIDESQAESIKTELNVDRPRFAFVKYIELKSKEIFWMTLYTLVLWAIFIERAYCTFKPCDRSID